MTNPKISLLKKVYSITLSNKGRNGDEVCLTTFMGNANLFKISDDFNDDKLAIAWKTIPELAAYFRQLADAVEDLKKQIEKE